MSEWDDNAFQKIGPASRGYFTFRLALWHDLRNEPDATSRLLNALVKNPPSPDNNFPSLLASAYLDGYQQLGILGACINAENLWHKALIGLYWDNPISFFNGFAMPPVQYGDVEVCDLDQIVELFILPTTINLASELQTRLENVGVKVYLLQVGDINLTVDGISWLF